MPKMIQYSIKDLEKISGIKAHTIRIWEKRYELLTPHRTDTNIRYYDNDQFRKILNIATLVNNGVKISKISKLTDTELTEQLAEILDSPSTNEHAIEANVNGLVGAMLSVDQEEFERIFAQSILVHGFDGIIDKIIYPFLRKVGLMWGISEIYPAQEHFVSNIIRQKLFTAIDNLPAPDNNAATWVLYLPEGEEHEIGLLVCTYLLRAARKKAIFLGQDVPFGDVQDIVELSDAKGLVTFFVKTLPEVDIDEYLGRLDTSFSNLDVIIAGAALPEDRSSIPPRFHVVDSIDAFKELI